jgi:hypothetical protein
VVFDRIVARPTGGGRLLAKLVPPSESPNTPTAQKVVISREIPILDRSTTSFLYHRSRKTSSNAVISRVQPETVPNAPWMSSDDGRRI